MALKAAYNFDTLTGGGFNQFTDHSGNFNTAQLSGDAAAVTVQGRRWYKQNYSDADFCLKATGTGVRGASIYGPVATSGQTAFSVDFWFWYPNDNGGTSYNADLNIFSMFITSDQTQDRGGVYLATDGKVGCWFGTSGGDAGGTTNDRGKPGDWNHVALVWNGANLRLWLNGVIRGEVWNLGGSINWTVNHVDLLGVEVWGGYSGERRIDDLRIYDHALTRGEVLRDMLTPVGYAPPNTPSPEYVSSNGKFFVDPSGSAMSEGNPLFLNARSSWGAFTDLPAGDWEGYIKGCAADGFNAIYVQICPGGTPTQAGNMPFTDANLTPNEAYWAEVDTFIQLCSDNGVVCLAHVMSAWDTVDWNVYTTATDDDAYMFGVFLQNRYPSQFVWLFAGGDWGVPHNTTLASRVNQMALGSASKWWFFHHTEETIGLEDALLAPRADMATTYSYQPTYLITRQGYASGKPSWFVEGNYEFENNNHQAFQTTKETLRRQVGWTITNGQFGTGKGEGRVWNIQGDDNDGWRMRMLTEGVQQQNHVLRKFTSTKWWTLVPDTADTFITAGAGTKLTTAPGADVLSNDFATATIATDKALAWVYVPTARNITFDKTKLGASITVTRVDPTGTTNDTPLYTGQANTGTLTIPSTSFPVHTAAREVEDRTTSDYLLKFTATPESSGGGGRPRFIVRGGSAVATTRYIARGGSLVQITN